MNDTINQVGAGAPADRLREALAGLLAIVDESRGVSGYHLNGAIAEWDEFPEVEAARATLDDLPECGCCGKTGECDADCDARQAAPAAPVADGTTSDKYRAELYDEVWQRARDMGYGNVTDALVDLERMKVAAPVVQEWPVVMPTDAQLIEIARRLGALPELCYTVDRPDIRWRVNPEVRAMVREVLTLYTAPPAHPDAAALVEALEQFADDSNWCYDTCDISRDVAKRSLAAYRAALAGKGGE